MNYLQRFRRALSALTDLEPHQEARKAPRRHARMETGDWLGQLHIVARRLPPRETPAREPSRRE